MIRTLLLRLVRLLGILLVVSFASFMLLQLVPGDPVVAALGENVTPELYQQTRLELGLDKPVLPRFGDWFTHAVQGDLGRSIVPPTQEVNTSIAAAIPVTLQISVMAMIMAVGLAIPFALWTAYRAGRTADTVVSGLAFAFISVPSFLSALLLIFLMVFHPGVAKLVLGIAGVAAAGGVVLSRYRSRLEGDGLAVWARRLVPALVILALTAVLVAVLPTFPRQGFARLTDGGLGSNLRSAFLPALTLALLEAAVLLRVLRSDLITTLDEDFILSAEAKGMPAWWIMIRHALRPASLPTVTVAGVALGRLLGGTVIVEAIFGLPGMGSLVVRGIQDNDYPVVQGCIIVLVILFVAMNALVDLSYAYLDPRIRTRHD